MGHKQKRTPHPSGSRVSVDEGLSPLLREMWQRGIETAMSCQQQETDGRTWILFDSPADAELFLHHLGSFDPDLTDMKSVPYRAVFGMDLTIGYYKIDNPWEWKMQWAHHRIRYCSTMAQVSVRFPAEDLPEVCRIFGV